MVILIKVGDDAGRSCMGFCYIEVLIAWDVGSRPNALCNSLGDYLENRGGFYIAGQCVSRYFRLITPFRNRNRHKIVMNAQANISSCLGYLRVVTCEECANLDCLLCCLLAMYDLWFWVNCSKSSVWTNAYNIALLFFLAHLLVTFAVWLMRAGVLSFARFTNGQ